MSRFLRECYCALEAYTPGEQPQDMQYIKLNTNESPFPPAPGVVEAITSGEVKKLRLYSDPTCQALKQTVAERYGVGADQVYLANGSDDILNFAFMAFGQNGVAYPKISYGFYQVFARLYGLEAAEIPLKKDFSIDPKDYCGLDRLIVIANPNAPTGMALSVAQVKEILEGNPNSVVVIDEAYVDFGTPSCLPLVGDYENLLVVQTFSKSRSMAGARLGFAFGSPALIADLEKLKYATNPYNINRLTQLAGIAAIKDEEYFQENCRAIMENRAYTVAGLEQLGFDVLPSQANFILTRTDRMSGGELYRRLKENGVLVRHFTQPEIADYNRITIGSRQEMDVFLSKVRELMGG